MKILLLNQTFYPDVASTAQHLGDLALALTERGHEVTVVTSRRAYDNPGKRFPKQEVWRGVRIIRVGSTGFGKGAKWKRAADFASFLLFCTLRLAFMPRPDVVVALTSPPLISYLGAWLVKLRGGRFYYWVMDFNPDEAIAAGWLRADSFAARLLDGISRFSLRHATKIIALDRFMQERICAKGIPAEKVVVIPPWSHDSEVRFDADGREKFRKAHGLQDKFVVMYSGNHSPCHPLDTLLKAAEQFAGDDTLVFCFVGGGSEFQKVKTWAARGAESLQSGKRKPEILCLPYQPLDQLACSLSAADLHLVVMGNFFVGLIHPCKVYNILSVGCPVLYIGPEVSHVPEILQGLQPPHPWAGVPHGAVEALVGQIQRIRTETAGRNRQPPSAVVERFSQAKLLPRLVAVLEQSDKLQNGK